MSGSTAGAAPSGAAPAQYGGPMLTDADRARLCDIRDRSGCWSCAELAAWILVHSEELTATETQTAIDRLTESRADCEALEQIGRIRP